MILYGRITGKRKRNDAMMVKARAINVSVAPAVANMGAMTSTGANDTLARPPADREESLRFTLLGQGNCSRGAGMR